MNLLIMSQSLDWRAIRSLATLSASKIMAPLNGAHRDISSDVGSGIDRDIHHANSQNEIPGVEGGSYSGIDERTGFGTAKAHSPVLK